MFAGIYYGGMYGGSTTSILLNTPGGVLVGDHRDRGQQDGQGRPSRAGVGDGGDRIVRRGNDRHHAVGAVRAGGVAVRRDARRAVVSRDHAVGAGRGHRGARVLRSCAACISLLLGLAIGLVGIDFADRPAARHVRPAAAVRRHRHRRDRGGGVRARRGAVGRGASAQAPRRGHPRRAAVDGQGATGSARGSRGCAAPPTGSRSARCPPVAPSCRRSCPTSPRRSSPSTRRSSARVPSRAWQVPRRPTTRRPRALWCRCCRWVCRPTPPPR